MSWVSEYVWEPPHLSVLEEGWIGFDNPLLWNRYGVRVERTDGERDILLKVGGVELTKENMQKVVYSALKTGQTEVNLEIGRESNAEAEADEEGGLATEAWYWDAFGLVDFECKRVYAVKVVVRLGSKKSTVAGYGFGCISYARISEYGDVVAGQTREAVYATEVVSLPKPEMEWKDEGDGHEWVDDVEDSIPTPAKAEPVSLPSSASGPGVGMDYIAGKLDSIDRNLGRIADALEKLATK